MPRHVPQPDRAATTRLITSQNPNWPHGQPLAVPVLETEVAADFLVIRTSDPD